MHSLNINVHLLPTKKKIVFEKILNLTQLKWTVKKKKVVGLLTLLSVSGLLIVYNMKYS